MANLIPQIAEMLGVKIKDISAVALLAAGWGLECPNCGVINSDDNDLPTYNDDKAYCGKCGAELVCLEDRVLRKTSLKKL